MRYFVICLILMSITAIDAYSQETCDIAFIKAVETVNVARFKRFEKKVVEAIEKYEIKKDTTVSNYSIIMTYMASEKKSSQWKVVLPSEFTCNIKSKMNASGALILSDSKPFGWVSFPNLDNPWEAGSLLDSTTQGYEVHEKLINFILNSEFDMIFTMLEFDPEYFIIKDNEISVLMEEWKIPDGIIKADPPIYTLDYYLNDILPMIRPGVLAYGVFY